MRKVLIVKVLIVVAAAVVAAIASPPIDAQVGPGYGIEMSRMIPMRDGVELEAWIFKPSHLKVKAPAVLTLTQYDIDGGRRGNVAAYTRRGYVFVQVYVRGRGRSGGVKSDSLGLQVGRDGYDVVEWIAAQPWSDGHVVMFGGSFVGMTQWRTAAQHSAPSCRHRALCAHLSGWDVPNTNGIPQAWSAVIMGYTSGRSLNYGVHCNQSYWRGRCSNSMPPSSFPGTGRRYRDCAGRLVDDRRPRSKAVVYENVARPRGRRGLQSRRGPKPEDFAQDDFPGAYRNRLLR